MSPMGRPALPPDEKKSATLSVRFTMEERTYLECAAADAGLSLSQWAHRELLGAPWRERDKKKNLFWVELRRPNGTWEAMAGCEKIKDATSYMGSFCESDVLRIMEGPVNGPFKEVKL